MTFPYRKALVTGGAGFIGSHLVERLLSLGLEVVSVDSYVTGKKGNLDKLRGPRLTDATCDVVDYDELSRLFDGVDIVFHNAASKKTVCMKDPRIDLDTNAKGTFNILELCRTRGVKKLVHASTGSVYGEARVFPTSETHPLDPCSYYGVSKLAGEKYVSTFGVLYDLDVSILRYFHVYGPRQDASDEGGVVAIFARRGLEGAPLTIHGDGTQIRSFTYVGDVVDANLLVATHPDATRQAFNVASGAQVSIQQLADRVRELTGRPNLRVEYDGWTTGDIRFFQVDNSKLKSLGFEFKTEFGAGLAATVDWFRETESAPAC